LAQQVTCPNPACGRRLDVPNWLDSQRLRCPFCEQVFSPPPASAVPTANGPSPPSATPGAPAAPRRLCQLAPAAFTVAVAGLALGRTLVVPLTGFGLGVASLIAIDRSAGRLWGALLGWLAIVAGLAGLFIGLAWRVLRSTGLIPGA